MKRKQVTKVQLWEKAWNKCVYRHEEWPKEVGENYDEMWGELIQSQWDSIVLKSKKSCFRVCRSELYSDNKEWVFS